MNWKFWQKDDDPFGGSDPFGGEDPFKDLSSDFSPATPPAQDHLGMPSMPSEQQPMQFTPDSHPSNVAFTPEGGGSAPKEADNEKQLLLQELILARLDSIKNQLDALNQRVANLERPQEQPGRARGKGPWYQ